jgi:hypothetical protein
MELIGIVSCPTFLEAWALSHASIWGFHFIFGSWRRFICNLLLTTKLQGWKEKFFIGLSRLLSLNVSSHPVLSSIWQTFCYQSGIATRLKSFKAAHLESQGCWDWSWGAFPYELVHLMSAQGALEIRHSDSVPIFSTLEVWWNFHIHYL